jgi:hypothetical protein
VRLLGSTNHGTADSSKDPGRREKELVSGFISSLASHKELPKELLMWMLDQGMYVCTL